MAKINKLSPGQIVYSVESHRMGNTTRRIKSLYTVQIISVDIENETVIASWNSNPPRTYYGNSISKWRVKKPEPKGKVFGITSY